MNIEFTNQKYRIYRIYFEANFEACVRYFEKVRI